MIVSSGPEYDASAASRKVYSPKPKPSMIHSGNVNSGMSRRRGAAFTRYVPSKAPIEIVFAIIGSLGCSLLSVAIEVYFLNV